MGLTSCRYSRPPLDLLALGPVTGLHPSTSTSSHAPNNTKHAHRRTARLVAAVVLVKAVAGLGTTSQNSFGVLE